jgi:hypothetical protein
MSNGRNGQTLVCFAAALVAFAAANAAAAELRLRQQCQSRTPVVTLGDVAEIITADSQEEQRLASIELLPAPPAGQQRFFL